MKKWTMILKINILFLCLTSCLGKGDSTVNSEYLKRLDQLNLDYTLTGNEKFLDSAYQIINSQKFIKSGKIDKKQWERIFPIYFKSQHYDELLELMDRVDSSEIVDFSNFNWYIKGYREYKLHNKKEGDRYVQDIVISKERQFEKNPNDSLLLMDLLYFKAHLVSRDSLNLIINKYRENSKFSKNYFENMLPEYINDFYRLKDKYIHGIN